MRNLSNEHDRKIANVLEAKYPTGSGKVRQLLWDFETQVTLDGEVVLLKAENL